VLADPLGRGEVPADEDQVLHLGGGLHGPGHHVEELPGGHHNPCAAVGHDGGELGAAEHRGDRDGHHPGAECGQDGGHHLHPVAHHQHHPVITVQAQRAEPGGGAAGQGVELGVGECPGACSQRDAFTVA